jgi:hypothetical protein
MAIFGLTFGGFFAPHQIGLITHERPPPWLRATRKKGVEGKIVDGDLALWIMADFSMNSKRRAPLQACEHARFCLKLNSNED